MMTAADAFISAAIVAGASDGPATLDETRRWVFLVSEAEALCDMGPGLESFIGAYGTDGLRRAAGGFAAAGAGEIAGRLEELARAPDDERLMDQAEELIAARTGYGYEAIRRAVEARLARREERPAPPQEHLALETALGLEACCALVREALGTGPFRFDGEGETEWGDAPLGGGVTVNVSRPYRRGTLRRWDPSVPEGCNVGVTVWPAAGVDVPEMARALAEVFGTRVHHHRTWLGPGRNMTFDRAYEPADRAGG